MIGVGEGPVSPTRDRRGSRVLTSRHHTGLRYKLRRRSVKATDTNYWSITPPPHHPSNTEISASCGAHVVEASKKDSQDL